MCVRDGISFSPQLRQYLVEDLALEGIVRPIELQIVSSYCIESKIETLGEYRQAGKAWGILKTFISKILENGSNGSEGHEFVIGGYILRLLCDDFFDSKRTDGGLSLTDLSTRVKAHVKGHFKGLKDDEYEKAFLKVLEKLIHRKLVLEVSENKFNLYHDYLVKGVKDLTTGLQTKEELAISMLQRFFATKKMGVHSRLKYNEYRFILKNLPERAYSDLNIRHTLRNQMLRYRRNLVIGLLSFIVGFTIFFPPTITYSVKTIETDHGFDDDYELNSPFNSDLELPTVSFHDTSFRAKFATLRTGENFIDLYPFNTEGHQIEKSNFFLRLPFPRGEFASIGEEVFMVDTGLTIFSHFSISKGYPFIRYNLSIPPCIKEDKKLLQIVKPNGDGVTYNKSLTSIFIDTVSHYFIAGNSTGCVFSLNYDNEPIRAYMFQNTRSTYKTLCVQAIAGDYYVNIGGPSGDTYVIRRKDNKVCRMTSQVQTLLAGGWLAYTHDYKYLYLFDTAKNEIRVYPPTLPIDSSDLINPVFTFQAKGWSPFDKVLVNRPFTNQRGQLTAGNPPYLVVQPLDSMVYLNILRSTWGTGLYLAGPDTTLKLPFRLMSFTSIKAFTTANAYVIIPYGGGPMGENLIYSLNKHDLTVRKSLPIDILNVKDIDSGKFDIVYLDSSRFFKVSAYSKGNLVVNSESIICSSNDFDHQVGAYWSDDGRYIYFVNGQHLYFGEKTGKFASVVYASKRELTNSEQIIQFFVNGKNLYARSFDRKFIVQRWSTIWVLSFGPSNGRRSNQLKK